MDDLIKWLAQQHSGLQTYKAFHNRALQSAAEDREHAALYQLLAGLVARFIDYYDEHPLPVDVADDAAKRLIALMRKASEKGRSAEDKLAVLNEIAAADLS